MVEKMHCIICDTTFNLPSDFWNHPCSDQHKYIIVNKSFYECECGYKTKFRKHYIRHLKSFGDTEHKKRPYEKFEIFKCKYCGTEFKENGQRERHEKTKKHKKHKAMYYQRKHLLESLK